jgi:hypothetical protein
VPDSQTHHSPRAPLGDYFELQLTFAARLADRTGLGLGEAVARYTNLRRRFALGNADDPAAATAWARYLAGLEAAAGPTARLHWTMDFHAQAPREVLAEDQTAFGCFACARPTDDGAVRIHFTNRAGGGAGPLSAARTVERLSELRAMFAFAREAYPSARSVLGGSWLYNLEAYRRLFPPAYGGSASLPSGPVRLTGSSTWGQFLDHRGGVKGVYRDHLLERLDTLDPDAPWRAFPLQALRASAPIEIFFAHYGV